nr:response regulator [uncultured Noviherbaspirillum sp.]
MINTSQIDAGQGLRILLVDDNEDASSSMAELLTLCGHTVRTAGDGAKALEAAALFYPQLVLSDIGLPGMDGYELAPALRRLAGPRPMVLAAVTGYGQPTDRQRAIEAGFDHHLIKPLEADILLRFIDAQARST